MTRFLLLLGQELMQLLSFFVTIALLQNIVLTTGFGSSIMMYIVRKPKNIWLFSGLLTGFSVLTALIAYPLDKLCGTAITNYWRPAMICGITVVLYVLVTLILRRAAPDAYARVGNMLPLAAFNNLVIGVALICNHSFALPLIGAVGLALGCCIGFTVLSLLTAEGLERLDSPDIPPAFRGLPATLIYVGLLALAILGFASSVSLI